jgi:hypothetical protein
MTVKGSFTMTDKAKDVSNCLIAYSVVRPIKGVNGFEGLCHADSLQECANPNTVIPNRSEESQRRWRKVAAGEWVRAYQTRPPFEQVFTFGTRPPATETRLPGQKRKAYSGQSLGWTGPGFVECLRFRAEIPRLGSE